MKKKTKRTLIVLICVVVFILVAGFAAYNIGIDYVQKKLVSSVVDKMIESGEVTISDLEAMLSAEEASGEDAEDMQDITPDKEGDAEKLPSSSQKAEQPKKTTSEEKPAQESSREETVDKFTDNLINSISRKEKLAMARIITSHLSGGDISYLTSLLAGGLTRDERQAAYKLAKQRFTAEELDVVSSYYHRYKARIMIEPDLVPAK